MFYLTNDNILLLFPLTLPLYLSIYLSLSLFLSLYLSFSRSISLSLALSRFLSPSLYLYLFLYLYFSEFPPLLLLLLMKGKVWNNFQYMWKLWVPGTRHIIEKNKSIFWNACARARPFKKIFLYAYNCRGPDKNVKFFRYFAVRLENALIAYQKQNLFSYKKFA